ncbi:MAG: U-box domain-containing protein, partial [Gammaproteobacteria bacterium]
PPPSTQPSPKTIERVQTTPTPKKAKEEKVEKDQNSHATATPVTSQQSSSSSTTAPSPKVSEESRGSQVPKQATVKKPIAAQQSAPAPAFTTTPSSTITSPSSSHPSPKSQSSPATVTPRTAQQRGSSSTASILSGNKSSYFAEPRTESTATEKHASETPAPTPPAITIPERYLCYTCPITLDFMKDPVIDHEGHSFERKAITEWISINKQPTCPVGCEPLKLEELVPNRALREAIEKFLKDNPQFKPSATTNTPSTAPKAT